MDRRGLLKDTDQVNVVADLISKRILKAKNFDLRIWIIEVLDRNGALSGLLIERQIDP